MQIKTIEKTIRTKLNGWLKSIEDEQLRDDVKKGLLLSGGSIANMLHGDKVNDYDIYLSDMDLVKRVAIYYLGKANLDINKHLIDGQYIAEELATYDSTVYEDENMAQRYIALKNTGGDRIKLFFRKSTHKVELGENPKPFSPVFFSPNAISLTDDIQIVLRFYGDNEAVHKTFDFIHATNYFTYEKGLVRNIEAIESILTRQLRYQGSLYPLTSIIRIKKFLGRGWKINAGEMLKIMYQISKLDLDDVNVLEDQLIGVDVAYFSTLINVLRSEATLGQSYEMLSKKIDEVFNAYDDGDLES